jgi:hypothetical protein
MCVSTRVVEISRVGKGAERAVPTRRRSQLALSRPLRARTWARRHNRSSTWQAPVLRLCPPYASLPGEIRELVNKVVEAERTAKANQIRRQEETAATRSLLNTAKLMEDNPLLLRLKELESLERLVEKVGRIDLHAGEGQGFDALLNKLVRMKADAPA